MPLGEQTARGLLEQDRLTQIAIPVPGVQQGVGIQPVPVTVEKNGTSAACGATPANASPICCSICSTCAECEA